MGPKCVIAVNFLAEITEKNRLLFRIPFEKCTFVRRDCKLLETLP